MMDNARKFYEPLVRAEEVLPILDKISLFGGLSETHCHTVFQYLQKVHYSPQEVIFHQGDHPSYIYIVLKGKVRLFFENNETAFPTIEFGPGACFGETSVIGIQSHSVTSMAVEDTLLVVLPREALMEIYENDKELFGLLMLNVAREASRRLHQTDKMLLNHLQHHEMSEV